MNQVRNRSSLNRVIVLLLLMLGAGLTGCASRPQLAQHCPEPIQRELNDDKILVSTSQGSTEIEPTVVGYREPDTSDPACSYYQDEFESFNRAMFTFNDKLYRWILIPVADGYVAVFPEPVRDSVDNFFSNIREPLNLVNHGLQFDGEGIMTSLTRFVVNSTVGLFGLFDPATHWLEIAEQKQTFAETLAFYGAEPGNYLVLPILGSSDVRGGVSFTVEGLANPVRYLSDDPETSILLLTQGIHDFSEQSQSYQALSAKTDDPYVFFRELYLQSRMRDKASTEQAQPEEE